MPKRNFRKRNFRKRNIRKRNIRFTISILLNLLIIVFMVIGTVVMLMPRKDANGMVLMSRGWRNLRYFTVLSNEFCGIVSLLWLIFELRGKRFPAMLKLMSVTGVGLTFIVVACFFAPMLPERNLYEGGNFWFHLIVPVTAMLEYLILDTDRIPARKAVIAALPSLLYGIGYSVNLLINGIGTGVSSNDWYGFLTWGYPTGILIFMAVILMSWIIACLMQLLNRITMKFLLDRNMG